MNARLLRAAAAVVLAVAGGLAGASPAAADPGSPVVVSGTWRFPAVCAEGEVTGTAYDTWVGVGSSVRRCADVDPALAARGQVGWAFFGVDGLASMFQDPVSTFLNAERYGAGLNIRRSSLAGSSTGWLRAVCLVSSPISRIACAAVGIDATGTPYVTPIPVNDPLVDRVVIVQNTSSGDPECGACV